MIKFLRGITPSGAPLQQAATLRTALTRLLGNVILLRDDHDSNRFYPRFNLHTTSSFHAFDASKHGLLIELHNGYYFRNQDKLWADCARRTIPALMQSTDMLMCGEDLGFVPACVPSVMRELGVIGLRIQRMPGAESPEGVPPDPLPPPPFSFATLALCVSSAFASSACLALSHLKVCVSRDLLPVCVPVCDKEDTTAEAAWRTR